MQKCRVKGNVEIELQKYRKIQKNVEMQEYKVKRNVEIKECKG